MTMLAAYQEGEPGGAPPPARGALVPSETTARLLMDALWREWPGVVRSFVQRELRHVPQPPDPPRPCAECHRRMDSPHSNQRYCSEHCSRAHSRHLRSLRRRAQAASGLPPPPRRR